MKRFMVAVMSVLVVMMGFSVSTAAITGTIDPHSISEVYSLGETKTYTANYTINITSGGGGGAADVLFLTDTTGSMGGYIGNVQTAFSGILSAVSSALPGVSINYGVADYKNYNDGGNYTANGVNLVQGFTSNTGSVQTALNSLSAGGGDDWAESNLKALQTVANNWANGTPGPLGFSGRDGAQKILIWAGDAPGHYAGEVGADGPPGYYPSLVQTLNALNAEGIKVFGLDVLSQYNGIDYNYDGTANQEEYLTSGTGGEAFYDVTGSGGVSDAVIGAIVPGVETLTNITLSATSGYDGFTVDPLGQTLIGSWGPGDSPVTGSFAFSVTAPLSDGTADFDMRLLGNGGTLDTLHMDLTTGAGVVPEPSALIIWLVLGAFGVMVNMWRRRKAA